MSQRRYSGVPLDDQLDEGVLVFKATFKNISVISWRPLLLVQETGVPGENNRPVASH
jgi:hypothetical protein